jgi:hypothetical protein
MLTLNKFTERMFYFSSLTQPETDRNFQYLQKFLKTTKIDNKDKVDGLTKEEK